MTYPVSGSISFSFLFRSLRRYWWAATVCLLLTILFGMSYLEKTDPVYESHVRVLIQRRDLSLALDAERNQEKEFLTTQAEVIKSPLTLTAALKEIPLTLLEQSKEEPVLKILEDLRVNPLATTDILKVTYRHPDPKIATARLKAILQSYQRNLRDQERSASTDLLVLLSRREKELRTDLRERQEQYAELRISSPVVGEIKNSLNNEIAPIRELTDRLTELRTRRLQLESALIPQGESTLSATTALSSSWDPEILRGMRELEGEIRDARAEQSRLESVYGSQHSRVQAIHARITQLEADYQRFLETGSKALRTQLETTRTEEVRLQEELTQERTRVKKLDGFLLQEAGLQQEIDQLQKLHVDTAGNLQSLKLTDQALEDGRASVTVKVLDNFTVPEEPLWPQPMIFMGISTIVGLFLGLIAVYLLAMASETKLPELDERSAAGDTEEQILQQMQLQLQELQSSVKQAQSTSAREPGEGLPQELTV